MAVPEQTPYNIYTANGITTVFPYEFYILQASDLAVSIDGATVTTGFTVSGVGTVNGGEVTFLIAPAAGTTVMLERIIPATRTTDYQNNGDLLADTVNKDFDRIWMAIRQAFISLGVALTRPLFGGPFDAKGYRIKGVGDPINDQDAATKKWTQQQDYAQRAKTLRVADVDIPALPNATDRQGKVLTFDNTGSPIVVVPASGSAADVMAQLGSTAGAGLVGTEAGATVQYELNTLNRGYTVINSDVIKLANDANSLEFTRSVVITGDSLGFNGFGYPSGWGVNGAG
ncbi:phage tail fiber domain-containing protein, partial [Pectobacterium odoriferum]|uniref:phage tail fiber domain-containing protein n=1 Tax=Pectobacterium odoriferum TaxID=78398 RepID=UPI0004FF7AFC